jgi:hypothetical protein
MLLFFFFQKPYYQVKIKMSFEAPKGKNPSLEELNSFLDALSNLHEYAILSTQPEYMDVKGPILTARKVLDYHKLEVKQICRKNPFDLELTFYIIQEGLITYWPFIKALIRMCKRYGRTANNLEETLSEIKRLFDELYSKYYRIAFISSIIRVLKIFDERTQLFEKLMSNLKHLMSDRKFREYYDLFCSSAIAITSIISFVDEFDESLELFKED